MSGIQNCLERKLYLKIILLGYLFHVYALKTLPYTLLLYGKQGTTDFGELRHKIPYYPAVLSCGLKLSSDNVNSPFYSCVLSDLAFEWKRGWS